MAHGQQLSPEMPDPTAVLTKAVLRASERLGLQQKDLAPVLGVSAASLSRLSQGRVIRPETKEGELAVLVVRLFRSRPAHRYERPIHEQIAPSIARAGKVAELRPVRSGLVVGHDGYITQTNSDLSPNQSSNTNP